MACPINEAQVKYDDGQDDDNDVQEDEGALCCQGASVLLQEKLTNWLSVCVLCVHVCVFCLMGLIIHLKHIYYQCFGFM